MNASLNASTKWGEYFPGHDMKSEFDLARRPGRGARRQIMNQCPTHSGRTQFWRETYRAISPCGAVFVVANKSFVIDVFPLDGAEKYMSHLSRYDAARLPIAANGAGREGEQS